MNELPYTTRGAVRGDCGHKHTLQGAAKCIRRDHEGCKSQGGYSDRYVVRLDGEELSDDEYDALNEQGAGVLEGSR